MWPKVLCLIFVLCFASQVESRNLQSEVDSLLNDYVVNHNFMGAILVAENGGIILAKGYGLADVENNIPNTPKTKFMIGSITKQFTAILVMQLVERGTLRLDNTISDFLPAFPRDVGDRITIAMLLSHRSGLPFPEGIEKYYYATTKDEYLQEFIKQLKEEGLRFEPGEGYGYSNAGYFILGLIIERVTGKPYEVVLKEQILQPLGMLDTGCDRDGLVLENRARSYQRLPDGYITWNDDTNGYDPSVCGFGYGNLYSTILDMFKFSEALSTTQLLSRQYMDMYLQMRTVKTAPPIPLIPQELVDKFFTSCGSGFVGEIAVVQDPETKEADTCYWHDGTWKLFKSNHFRYTGKDQVIIICSNCSFLCEGNEMVLKIHQLLNNKPYDHIIIKHSLSQYISEDVAMHAGIPAAIDEYHRFKDDTAHFIVPGQDWLIWAGRYVAEEMGDLDNAILLLQTAVSEFPESWEGYDALAETHLLRGDTAAAIQCCRNSLAVNPANETAKKMITQLGGK
ncbi:MAG TPA: serine hydrolase [Acidobacteriota bacterium]|nr:serine hydrolase [Acidobacteriota bacterium]